MDIDRLIIDVRETFEYELGHVEGAINVPLSELSRDLTVLQSFNKDSMIIVYCRTGSRANTSIKFLKKMGFTNLINGINVENIENNLKLHNY